MNSQKQPARELADLEMTKLCAEAMGFTVWPNNNGLCYLSKVTLQSFSDPNLNSEKLSVPYDPLRDDTQAMALVKRFEISIAWSWPGQVGCMSKEEARQDEDKRHDNISCDYKDLNRAIVECVAKTQRDVSVRGSDNATPK